MTWSSAISFLASMTDQCAELVLHNNRRQTQAISLGHASQ